MLTEPLTIVLEGQPITKKNSQRMHEHGKRCPACNRGQWSFPAPSKQFEEYQEAAGWMIRCKGFEIDTPLNLKAIYYMQTRRNPDLVNLLEATCDILVHYKVVEDDNGGIVVSHDGCRIRYDKNRPRVEITLTPAEDVEYQIGFMPEEMQEDW
jgi:Holliday junction resolvase RusA-like endonuclease